MSGSYSIELHTTWWTLCVAFHHEMLTPVNTLPTKIPRSLFRFTVVPRTELWPVSCPTNATCCQKKPSSTPPSSRQPLLPPPRARASAAARIAAHRAACR